MNGMPQGSLVGTSPSVATGYIGNIMYESQARWVQRLWPPANSSMTSNEKLLNILTFG